VEDVLVCSEILEEETMKIPDQLLLELWCELEEFVTTRFAMIAMNQERMQRGESQAYNEKAFMDLSNNIQDIRKRIIHLGEN